MVIAGVVLSQILGNIPVHNESGFRDLVLNAYHEARGESVQGIASVTHVVLNRVKSRRFPNSIHKVIYQHKQFSWTHDPLEVKLINEIDRVAFEKVVIVVGMVYNGMIVDPTQGSLHYYNPHKVEPIWAENAETLLVAGNHKFVRLVK